MLILNKTFISKKSVKILKKRLLTICIDECSFLLQSSHWLSLKPRDFQVYSEAAKTGQFTWLRFFLEFETSQKNMEVFEKRLCWWRIIQNLGFETSLGKNLVGDTSKIRSSTREWDAKNNRRCCNCPWSIYKMLMWKHYQLCLLLPRFSHSSHRWTNSQLIQSSNTFYLFYVCLCNRYSFSWCVNKVHG